MDEMTACRADRPRRPGARRDGLGFAVAPLSFAAVSEPSTSLGVSRFAISAPGPSLRSVAPPRLAASVSAELVFVIAESTALANGFRRWGVIVAQPGERAKREGAGEADA